MVALTQAAVEEEEATTTNPPRSPNLNISPLYYQPLLRPLPPAFMDQEGEEILEETFLIIRRVGVGSQCCRMLMPGIQEEGEEEGSEEVTH